MDAKLRPEIEALEPAVLTPGGKLKVKLSNLPGHDIQLIVPNGAGYDLVPVKVTRDGNIIEATLPADLNAGKLYVRSDLMLSDPVLFELGSNSPNGLRAEYFKLENPRRSLPEFDELEPELIRRDTALDFADAASFKLPFAEDFGVRWTGQLQIEEAGEYEFALEADDRARLIINDEHSVESGEDPIKLTVQPGKQKITVLYLQRGGEAKLSLKWKKAEGEFETVPTTALLFD